MRQKFYIIQSLIDQGYWNEVHSDFKGVIYAKKFNSEEEAEDYVKNKMPKFIPSIIVTIIPIYCI